MHPPVLLSASRCALLFQRFRDALRHIYRTRKSNTIAPHFIFRAVGMELVIPAEHLLFCIVLDLLTVDGSVGISHFKPEAIFLFTEAFFRLKPTPTIWKSLKPCAFGWRQTANDVILANCS